MLNLKRSSLVAVVVTSIGALSACGYWQRSPEKRADWMVKEITEELSLNETQQAKLNIVKQELLTVRSEFKESHEATHDKIKQTMAGSTLDREALQALVSEKTRYVDETSAKLIGAIGDFYDSLNAEQQAKVRDHLTDRMDHHRRH